MRGKTGTCGGLISTTISPYSRWKKVERRRESICGTYDFSTETSRNKLRKLLDKKTYKRLEKEYHDSLLL